MPVKRFHARHVPVPPNLVEHLGLRVAYGALRPKPLRAWIVAFVVTIAFLTISRPSFALEPVPPRGSNKITSGFALMASGLVVTGVGAAVYVANENSGKTDCTPCAQKSAVFPVTLMVLGGAIFVTGGTLFTIGLVQNSRASARVTIGPFGGSLRVLF